MSDNADDVLVQILETVVTAVWGELTHLKIYTPDYRPLNWPAVWQAFADVYPGRWALELYPPAGDLVNDAHVYHLWLFPPDWQPPQDLNLAHRYR